MEAVLERIVEKVRVLEAQALSVWAGLLGAGVEGIHLQYGTVCGAHRALHAFLKVVGTGSIFLKLCHVYFKI